MEEENLKKYLYIMNRAIRSGNPKYMSYVSKEYMKYKTASPVIAETIKDMLVKESFRNPKTPYAVFIDSDGINEETMSDISKISNLPQFISEVQSLTEYDISFVGMTSDDLILNSEQIALELEQEFNEQIQDETQTEEQVEKGAQGILSKVGLLAAIGGTVGSIFKGALSRIKSKLAGIKGKKTNLEEKNMEETTPKVPKQKPTTIFDSIPKAIVNEQEALRQMRQNRENDLNKTKNSDTYGDGDPDGDDIDL